jgi:TRAP-type C4-dicarboxylate transport system substrate-binding protein
MKKNLFVIIAVLLCLVWMGGLISASAAEKKITWKFSTVVPETDADWYVTQTRIKELIEEGSGGQIEVKIFPGGVICDPDSVVDAVAQGAIQGGVIISSMAADRVPSVMGIEMPFGARDMYEHYELMFLWGLADIMREEFATRNIHYLAPCYVGGLIFYSNFPVKSVEDFKGKKIWSIPTTNFLMKFGAAAVDVPGVDMYTAMKLGTIEGFVWTTGELEVGNFKEVCKYVMQPRLITAGSSCLVNKAAWDKLGKQLQMRIHDHIFANQLSYWREYEEFNQKAIKAAKEYGVEFVELPAPEVNKLRAASRDFYDYVAGLSPHAGKMIKRYKEFLKYKGIE